MPGTPVMFCIAIVTSPTDCRQHFVDITSFVGKAAPLTKVGLIPNIEQCRNFSVKLWEKMIRYNENFPYCLAMLNTSFLQKSLWTFRRNCFSEGLLGSQPAGEGSLPECDRLGLWPCPASYGESQVLQPPLSYWKLWHKGLLILRKTSDECQVHQRKISQYF